MLREGDRVILVIDRYRISPNNPLIGSKFYCEGVITRNTNNYLLNRVRVLWDNGLYNSYEETDLKLVENVSRCKSIW